MSEASDSWLHEILSATRRAREEERTGLERFLEEQDPWRACALWLELSCGPRPRNRRELGERLLTAIARLDELLSLQLDAILHAPAMQRLEASWRGLRYLCEGVDEEANVKIRVLSLSWRELTRDLERAIDFDQSQLFRKIYNEEFGTPGGEPYGLLLADYELRHRPAPGYPHDDLSSLASLQEIAAASFAPLIAAVHPAFFGLDSFRDLERPIDIERVFATPEYRQWHAIRSREDARFIGLTLPRVLARLPHRDNPARTDGFCYEEDVSAPDASAYLWGTAVYAFGSTVLRAFAESGWLAGIRGVERDTLGGGLITDLPREDFPTDAPQLAPRGSTDVLLTDRREKELSDLGFIPLGHCHGTGWSAFYSNQSIQRIQSYDEESASVNAKLSAMLQYMLCVSRFAHYIKVIGRDKVGSFASATECEHFLNNWLVDYSTSNEDASAELQAKYPLREARVQIREVPGKPGVYSSVIHLRPHFQLDQMSSTVKLVTELFSSSA